MTSLEEANQTASQLYTTFCEAQNNRNIQGDPLPTWESLLKDTSKTAYVRGWLTMAYQVRDQQRPLPDSVRYALCGLVLVLMTMGALAITAFIKHYAN